MCVAQIRVAIAVSDEALAQVEDVMRACSALGFRGDSQVPVLGVFTGCIAAHSVAALRAVRGVAAVEIQRDIRFDAGPQRPH